MNHSLTQTQMDRIYMQYLPCLCNEQIQANYFQQRYMLVRDYIHYGWKRPPEMYLTPIEKITDEDAKWILSLAFAPGTVAQYKAGDQLWQRRLAKIVSTSPVAVFYLILKKYAVPLFIEPDHPDNDKTAIEMGIAYDQTLPPYEKTNH